MEQPATSAGLAVNESQYEEQMLVHYWRFALEGVLIPCVSLPGIMGRFLEIHCPTNIMWNVRENQGS